MNDVRVRIPIEIEITVTVGAVESDVDVVLAQPVPAPPAEERFVLDEDYTAREGYDAGYLGVEAPMPTLTEDALLRASRDPDVALESAHILPYHHFSVVMNKERRVLFFAAWNTTRDPERMGTKGRKALSGGQDKWILDPRIPAGHQVTTAELYKRSGFDRGHIVRREDAYWGETELEAEHGNFDTFHYTNCTPQHPAYNQASQAGLWGKLEDHIADEALDRDMNLSIFAGPVLAKNDPTVKGVQVPRRFWKIVLGRRRAGGLGAWAFLLSQAKLVREPREESVAEFSPGEFRAFQVSVARIAELTDVRFDEAVTRADRFKKTEEAGTRDVAIEVLSDVVL